MFNNEEFNNICIQLQYTFPKFKELLQEQMKTTIFTCKEDKIEELRIQYAYLDKLETIVKNTVINLDKE